MHEKPLVSVICLCYNHDDFVVESLNSVLSQNYQPIEMIIIDDCSTDNSVAVIEKWLENRQNITFIKNTKNLGNTKSFNKAAKITQGNYLIDLATDDILLNNCIALQIERFNTTKHSNVAIVYSNVAMIDEKGNSLENYFPTNSEGKLLTKRESGNEYIRIIAGGKDAICTVGSMIKKDVYQQLNGYDEALAYEDLDFWIRASRIYNFDFIDEVLIQKRVVANSLGTNFHLKKSILSKKINYSTYQIIKKVYLLNNTKVEDRAILKRLHYEMILNFKNSNYALVLKYVLLEFKIRIRLSKTNTV